RGRGLEPADAPRPAVEPKPRQPERDRPRRDHTHGLAPPHDPPDLAPACAQDPAADAPASADNEARAELDHDRHAPGPHAARRAVTGLSLSLPFARPRNTTETVTATGSRRRSRGTAGATGRGT